MPSFMSTHMCRVLCLEALPVFVIYTATIWPKKSSLLNVICMPHTIPKTKWLNLNATNHMIKASLVSSIYTHRN